MILDGCYILSVCSAAIRGSVSSGRGRDLCRRRSSGRAGIAVGSSWLQILMGPLAWAIKSVSSGESIVEVVDHVACQEYQRLRLPEAIMSDTREQASATAALDRLFSS